jgi:Na+/H+ antiporter NhaD/arsenite permease-like protein
MMQDIVHSVWSLIPFLLMLLIIAIAPLFVAEWWDSNRHKLAVTILLVIPTAVILVMGGMAQELEHQILGDYIPFIVLLTSLYVITGGIHLSGDIKAKPWVNTVFLAVGWLLASFMGTTGAAMLLIRPLLTTNQQREHKVHTILFFIA